MVPLEKRPLTRPGIYPAWHSGGNNHINRRSKLIGCRQVQGREEPLRKSRFRRYDDLEGNGTVKIRCAHLHCLVRGRIYWKRDSNCAVRSDRNWSSRDLSYVQSRNWRWKYVQKRSDAALSKHGEI